MNYFTIFVESHNRPILWEIGQKLNNMKTRNFTVIFLSLFLTVTTHAQYPGARLEINSTTGVYAIGDSIKVWADVFPGCAPSLEFKIEKNMLNDISKKEVSLTEGRHLLYADVCSETAHYVFMLGLPEGKPQTEKTSVVGAIVNPEGFKAGYPVPEDLREFWDEQIAKMREMKLKASVKEIPAEDGYVCFDIEIPMPEGNPARAYLAYPKDAPKKSLPIVIRTHSAGVKGKWCQCSVANTIKDAQRGNGAIALDINAHGMLNGQPQEYYDKLWEGELNRYYTRDFTGHEDFYFRLMYLRMVRALDYLVTLPQWDGERVAVYGGSQGGAQAAALAGIDKRVTIAMLSVPAFMDVGGKLDNRAGSWPKTYSRTPEKYGKYLTYYDGASLLTLTKAKLYFEAGLVDYTCPPACVATGYYNAASDDKTIVYFPYRPHTASRMEKEFYKIWQKEIRDPREAWFNAYLK